MFLTDIFMFQMSSYSLSWSFFHNIIQSVVNLFECLWHELVLKIVFIFKIHIKSLQEIIQWRWWVLLTVLFTYLYNKVINIMFQFSFIHGNLMYQWNRSVVFSPGGYVSCRVYLSPQSMPAFVHPNGPFHLGFWGVLDAVKGGKIDVI